MCNYRGLDYDEIADLLYVHVSTVRRVINKYNSTGDVAPQMYRHGPERSLGQCEEICLVESLLANPAIYLDELQEELYETTGTWCSVSTIHRTVHRLGFTRKKNASCGHAAV